MFTVIVKAVRQLVSNNHPDGAITQRPGTKEAFTNAGKEKLELLFFLPLFKTKTTLGNTVKS